MRIIAFLAGLAGLIAMGSQGTIIGLQMAGMAESQQDILQLVFRVGRWAQPAFILFVTLFLFLFALSKRPTAS